MIHEAPWGTVKSAEQLRAEAPKVWWARHWIVEERDYAEAINLGHRFFALDGRELKTFSDVQAELARAGEKGIESR